ncbi:hypothetical protein BDW02DRAFT_505893 [Decorospora gaudefroyi]|uniref:Uncharacterized protein n=1 Tax=Decorospora gaudefroyi TaxID=184978 RepID=A0A6A5K9R2_9PLEO|nr:hypothetical protein BDW02DRAFT_505893 [Decorospora gaudefroyi]
MAPGPKAKEQDRPDASGRMHSGLEDLLPADFVDMQKCAGDFPKEKKKLKSSSRPSATPLPSLSRSVSSMTDSFMLEHWGSSSKVPQTRHDGNNAADHPPPKEEDAPTVISNWAHLSYIKAQRNTLRAELKAHQIAGAEAKRSVTSLRRLAFRMAVNISVKEKQIATTARNLAKSRTSSYLDSRDAQKRIEGLQRSLRVEEGRNKEILEALERASMLTLQYSTAETEAQHRPEGSFLSPPPSPPTRHSNPSESPLISPKTPTRSLPSPWHDVDLELTPRITSPRDIRTSDSRLIRAKRESDHALAACRSRIEALQHECSKSQEDGKLLEATREGLEREITSHQTRIATLERSRATVEKALESTKTQLDEAMSSEEILKRELEAKSEELMDWEQKTGDKQHAIEALQREKQDLKQNLGARNAHFNELETRTAALEETLQSLHSKLKAAESHQTSLQDRLTEKESAREDMKKELEQSAQHLELLKQKIAEHESDAAEQLKKIDVVDNDAISALREQLKESQTTNENTEKAVAALKEKVALLHTNWQTENDARDGLVKELDAMRAEKANLEDELRATRENFEQETSTKTKLRAELETMRLSYASVESELENAQHHIRSLEAADVNSQSKLEVLRDAKTALETDLKEARQVLFRLREDLRMSNSELADVQSAKSDLQRRVQVSEERVSSLEKEVEQTQVAKQKSDEQHATDVQKRNEHLRGLEASVLDLRSVLASSEKLEASLREELCRVQSAKDTVDGELGEAMRSKTHLEGQVEHIQSRLTWTESDRDSLKTKITQLEEGLEMSSQTKAHLEERLASSADESKRVKDVVSELETALRDSDDAKSKVEEALSTAQLEGETSGTEIANLQSRLDGERVAKEETQGKLNDAVSSKTDLEKQLHLAEGKLAEVDFEDEEIRSQLSKVEAEAAGIRQSKEQVEDKLRMLQASHDTLNSELQSTRAQLQAAEVQIPELETRLASTEEELDAMSRTKTAVEKRLEETRHTNSDLEDELQLAQNLRRLWGEIEDRLSKATTSNAQLQADLETSRSQISHADAEHVQLASRLTDAEGELETLQRLKGDVEKKLSEALTVSTSLEQDLLSTRSRLQELESNFSSTTAELTERTKELAAVRHTKGDLEQKLEEAGQHALSLQDDLSAMHLRVEETESTKTILVSQLSAGGKELQELRATHTKLEDELRATSKHTGELENSLHGAQMRLEIAESEGLDAMNRLLGADQELTSLRDANTKRDTSEKELFARLAGAEEELDTVREKNARLEAFLERMQSDMTDARNAAEDTEKRYQEFAEESQAKLDAAKSSKLRYKRLLSGVTNENSELHHQIGEQTRQLGVLKKGKARLETELSKKEKYIEELGSSTDKRIRSMNSAYNSMKKKLEEQQPQHQRLDQNHERAIRLEAELERKITEMEEIQHNQGHFEALFHALEQEVRTLREDKKAFEKLVATLQEKIRQLEVLEEWDEPGEAHRTSSPRHITIQDGAHDTAPSKTRASTVSREEDLESWARQVERVRTQRNETAVQLKGMKKSRHNLKRTLRDTEAQLHRLEKETKPTRPPNLLRKKSRPVSALGPEMDLQTPTRPTTSHGFSFSPRSTLSTRHSTYLPPPERPATTTPERPRTSHSLRNRLSGRPTTSMGDERPKEKRRWSSGLRSLFHRG